MDEGFGRLRSIVERALELDVTERDAFLEAECSGDAELRREAGEWLSAAADDSPFLEPPPRRLSPKAPSAGDRVGPFRLTRVVATGGMGTVYEAEQERLAAGSPSR